MSSSSASKTTTAGDGNVVNPSKAKKTTCSGVSSPRPSTSAATGNRVVITSTCTTDSISKNTEVKTSSGSTISGSGTREGAGRGGNWTDPSTNYFKGQRIRRRSANYRGAGFRGGPLHVHNRQKWLSIDEVYGGGYQGPRVQPTGVVYSHQGFFRPPQYRMAGQGAYPRRSVHERLGGYAHNRGNPFIRPQMGHPFGSVSHSMPQQEEIDLNESRIVNQEVQANPISSSYPPSFNRGASSSNNPFLNSNNFIPGQRKRNAGLLPTPILPMKCTAMVPSDESQWWTANDETFLANKYDKTEPVDDAEADAIKETTAVVKVPKAKAKKVGSLFANKTEEVKGKRVIGVFGWFISTTSILNPYIPVLPRLNPPQSTPQEEVVEPAMLP